MPVHEELSSIKKRYLVLLAVLSCFVAFCASLLYGGKSTNALIAHFARRYLDALPTMAIGFDALRGSPLEGYELTGLKVGTRQSPSIVSVDRLLFKISPQSWTRKKLVFSLETEGINLKEDELSPLAEATQKDFPSSPGEPSPLPFAAERLSISGLSGSKGWKVQDCRMQLREGGEALDYDVGLDALYMKEPLKLTGTISLNDFGSCTGAHLRVQALGSDVSFALASHEGLISLNEIKGKLFSSPVNGACSIDFNSPDCLLKGDLTLKKLDFKRLSRWLPKLGPSSIDLFQLKLSGPMKHPEGQITLKGGKLSWQNWRLSGINGTLNLDSKKALLDLTGSWMGAHITAKGSAGLSGKGALDIKAALSGLSCKSLSELIPEARGIAVDGTLSLAMTASGTMDKPQVQLSVQSKQIVVDKLYRLTDLSALVLADRSAVTLQKLSLQAFQGALQASGILDISNMKAPTLNFSGTVSRMQIAKMAPGQKVQGALKGSFSASGPLSLPQIGAEAELSKLGVYSYKMDSVKVAVQGAETLNFKVEGATPMKTPLVGEGTVVMPYKGKEGFVDFTLNFDDISLTSILPKELQIGGTGSVALLAKGPLTAPLLSCRFSGPRLQMSGFTVMDPVVLATLKGESLEVDASIALGDRRPKITGTVELKKDWKCELNCSADDISIGALAPALQGQIMGRATLSAHSVVTSKSASAVGSVTAKSIGLKELALTDLRVPFSYINDKITIRNGGALFCGGTVLIQAQGNVSTSVFTADLKISDMDLAKMTEPFGLPATVTGKAELALKGKARFGITTISSGDGSFSLSDVELKDFPSAGLITGGAPVRVKKGKFFFNFDENEFYMMPGSSLTAAPDDKLFRYVAVSGSVWRREAGTYPTHVGDIPSDLALRNRNKFMVSVSGNINVTALNSVLSGFSAIIDSGISGNLSGQALATNMLQKLIGGARSRFRDFSLQIGGPDYSDYKILNLKIEGDTDYAGQTNSTWTREDPQKDKALEFNYEFKYAIPIGPDPSKLKDRKK